MSFSRVLWIFSLGTLCGIIFSMIQLNAFDNIIWQKEQTFLAVSDSMYPMMTPGDTLHVVDYTTNITIKKGMVVVYNNEDSALKSSRIMHIIVGIYTENNTTMYVTKGINNFAIDKPIRQDQITHILKSIEYMSC